MARSYVARIIAPCLQFIIEKGSRVLPAFTIIIMRFLPDMVGIFFKQL
jgi:hypothetical protein